MQVGLDVVKVFMISDIIHDMGIAKEDINITVEYMKDNFNMRFPILKDNICDKHDYRTNLRNALFKTHYWCDCKGSECFCYDVFAYSKVFYHLELYNRKDFIRTYQEYLKK